MEMIEECDSAGRPMLIAWISREDDERKKVYRVKTKDLVIVLIKRHIRAVVFRIKKIRGK